MRGYGKVAVAGGVAANRRIRADLQAACRRSGDKLFLPELQVLRRQRRHDRLPGLLRVSGRPSGRPDLMLTPPGISPWGKAPVSRRSPAPAGSAGRGGAAERMTIRGTWMGMIRSPRRRNAYATRDISLAWSPPDVDSVRRCAHCQLLNPVFALCNLVFAWILHLLNLPAVQQPKRFSPFSPFFHNLVENRVEIVHNSFSLFFSTKHYVNFKVPPHSVFPEDSPVFFKDSAGFSPFSLDKRSCGC